MKIKPLRGYVFIQLLDGDSTSASGLTLPDVEKQRNAKGKVLAVGLPSYKVIDTVSLLMEVLHIVDSSDIGFGELEKGDTVVFKRFAGEAIKEGDKEYMLVPYKEVLGVYET